MKWSQKGKGFRGYSMKRHKSMIRQLEAKKATLLERISENNAKVVELIGPGQVELLKIKLLDKRIR